MSEHVDVDSSEMALFLLEVDKRRDPWEQSCFVDGCLLGALPHGSGGSEDVGELENTSEPWGLQLMLLCEGMGILGDTDGTTVGEELGAHPLETSTQGEATSSENKVSVGELMRKELLLTRMGSNVGSRSMMSWLRFSREISRSGSSW